jgi:hypothetical protein
MRLTATIFTVLVLASGAQSPQIQNAQLQTQAVTSLARDVAAVAAQSTASAPIWVAWQVPMVDGERSLCCYYNDDNNSNGVRGCWMEPAAPDERRGAPQFPAPTGAVKLEANTQLTMYVRLVDQRVERLRTLSDECPVDAGGRAVRWLTGVTGADSVAWLRSVALDEKMDIDVRSRLASSAVRAVALHRDPSAVTTLLELARAQPATPLATSVRREAMTGLGQSRDPRALQFLQGIITK